MDNRWLHDMNMRYLTNHGAMMSYQQEKQQQKKREGVRRRKERERVLNLTQSLLDEEKDIVEALPAGLMKAWETYLEACRAHLCPPVPVSVSVPMPMPIQNLGEAESIDKYIETHSCSKFPLPLGNYESDTQTKKERQGDAYETSQDAYEEEEASVPPTYTHGGKAPS